MLFWMRYVWIASIASSYILISLSTFNLLPGIETYIFVYIFGIVRLDVLFSVEVGFGIQNIRRKKNQLD